MIAASVEPTWPLRRWLTVILLILSLQIALIFSLAERHVAPLPAIPTEAGVAISSNPEAEWPGLSNPAQFVLASRSGFSGKAWMEVPALPYDLPKWIDPSPQLGNALTAYLRTNLAGIFERAPRTEPEPALILPFESLPMAQSTLTIEGELAHRPLLTKIDLPSWPSAEILSESVVLAGVDQSGNVFSAILLSEGKSGSKDADASALRQVNAARFQPLRPLHPGQPTVDESRLHWGRLIFHWNTVAPPPTNASLPSNLPPALQINLPHE